MKNIFFLGHKGAEYDEISRELKERLDKYIITSVSGNNIDVKEFVRVKLKDESIKIDCFILDVRALHSLDYTTILSFRGNIMEKFPSVKHFLVIAKQSDGLSCEEYNDIVRNSVNGKNYTLFSDSDLSKIISGLIDYISDIKDDSKPLKNTQRAINKISDDDSIRSSKRKANTRLDKEDIQITDISMEDEDSMKIFNDSEEQIDANITSLDEMSKTITFINNSNIDDLLSPSKDEALNKMYDNHYDREDIEIKSNITIGNSSLDAGKLLGDLNPEQSNSINDILSNYNHKFNWNSYDNTVYLFGTDSNIGTSFVSMSLALSLKELGAKSAYVQINDYPDLDDKASDYEFTDCGAYYEHKGVSFVKNAFAEDRNYHVIDLGSDISRLKKAANLGWLDNGILYLVAIGNTKGLRMLDYSILQANKLSVDFEIIIVDGILSRSEYKKYTDDYIVHFFEHTKKLNDYKNNYMLKDIGIQLYQLSEQ